MEYPIFPDQPFIKMFSMAPQSDEIDVWHVAGNRQFHQNSASREFIELCKSKLTPRKLPIYIGGTGYIHWKEAIPKGAYCWDQDELGRLVVILNDMWLFQRYTNGDVLVWTKISSSDWHSVSMDKLQELTSEVQAL